MKKILYMLLCIFMLVGCTHQSGGNTGTSSSTTTSNTEPVVTTTTPVVTTTTPIATSTNELITIIPTIESDPLKDGVYKCQQYSYRYTEVIIEDGKFSFGFYDYTDGRSENRVEGNVVELHKDLYYLALDDKNKEVYLRYFHPLILRVIDNEVYTIDINTYYFIAEDAQYNVIEGYWDEKDLPTTDELMNFLYTDYLEKCEYSLFYSASN